MHGEESQFCHGTNIILKCSLEHKCPVAKTEPPNQPPGDPEGYGVASGLRVEWVECGVGHGLSCWWGKGGGCLCCRLSAA